jgi:hypothetical protein
LVILTWPPSRYLTSSPLAASLSIVFSDTSNSLAV